MKQVPPSSKSRFVQGAFIFDEAAIQRLIVLARGYFGEEVEADFQLHLSDGSQITTSALTDLDNFPFHHVRDRGEFRVTVKTIREQYPRPDISIHYSFKDPRAWVRVDATDKLAELFRSSLSFVEGTRAWYSALYSFPSLMGIATIGSISLGILEIANKNVILGQIVLAVLGLSILFAALIVGARYLLFDPLVTLFGEEVNRNARRISLRRGLCVFVFGGVAIAAVGAFFQRLFANG